MQFKKIILSVFFLISFLPMFAQRAEIGVNAGGSGYMGDLNQFNPLKVSGLNYGAFGKLNLDPHWGIGLHLNKGVIQGDDALSKNPDFVQRNLNFKTTLTEIAFIGSFNFLDMYSPGSRKRVTPYLFAGAGGVIFRSIGKYQGEWQPQMDLRDLNTEDLPGLYRNYSIVIPYGAGVKYKKNDNWTLFGQIGYRTTFTDYLDDVSGVYPTVNKTWGSSVDVSDRSGELTGGVNRYSAGDQRGDFRKRDTYLFVNIGISYTFVSQKCFTF